MKSSWLINRNRITWTHLFDIPNADIIPTLPKIISDIRDDFDDAFDDVFDLIEAISDSSLEVLDEI